MSLYDQCTCDIRQTRRIADPRDLAIAHEHRLVDDNAGVDHVNHRDIAENEWAIVGSPIECVEKACYFDFLGNPMKGGTIVV